MIALLVLIFIFAGGWVGVGVFIGALLLAAGIVLAVMGFIRMLEYLKDAFKPGLSWFERGRLIGHAIFEGLMIALILIGWLKAGRLGELGEGRELGGEGGEVAKIGELSEALKTARAGLKDQKAINQFDAMFERMGKDSSKMEPVIEEMSKDGNLEQKLIELADTGGRCFVAGTRIWTEAGERAIEDLAIGDKVIAFDPRSGKQASQRIVNILKNTVPVTLELRIGATTIRCSPEHPFWIPEAGWCQAGTLTPGTSLRAKSGVLVTVDTVKREAGSSAVFNIEVEGFHTYFVSDLGILVHNKGELADPVGQLRSRVESLSARVRTALTSAKAQPSDTPGRAGRISRLEDIQKAVDQLQKESNAPAPDVDDLSDWADGIDNDLHPIEQQLPEPAPPEPTPTQPLTAEDAFHNLQRRRLWNKINEDYPDRKWSADEKLEEMPSDPDKPHEVKRKLNLTGRREGQPPVKVEVSVIYDRNTGTFEDMHYSSGKSPRQ